MIYSSGGFGANEAAGVGDFDADGSPDVLVANSVNSFVALHRGGVAMPNFWWGPGNDGLGYPIAR
jgi:hypothetical protein